MNTKLNTLPAETLTHIALYLPPQERCNLIATCKKIFQALTECSACFKEALPPINAKGNSYILLLLMRQGKLSNVFSHTPHPMARTGFFPVHTTKEGAFVCRSTNQHNVDVWNGDTKTLSLEHSADVRCLKVSDTGQIVTATRNHTLTWWNNNIKMLEVDEGDRLTEETMIASNGNIITRIQSLWNLYQDGVSIEYDGTSGNFEKAIVTNDGDLAIITKNYPARMSATLFRNGPQSFTTPNEFNISCIEVTQDGKFILGEEKGRITLWKEDRTILMKGHTDRICELKQLPNKLIASGCADNTLRIWQEGTQIAAFENFGGERYHWFKSLDHFEGDEGREFTYTHPLIQVTPSNDIIFAGKHSDGQSRYVNTLHVLQTTPSVAKKSEFFVDEDFYFTTANDCIITAGYTTKVIQVWFEGHPIHRLEGHTQVPYQIFPTKTGYTSFGVGTETLNWSIDTQKLEALYQEETAKQNKRIQDMQLGP